MCDRGFGGAVVGRLVALEIAEDAAIKLERAAVVGLPGDDAIIRGNGNAHGESIRGDN